MTAFVLVIDDDVDLSSLLARHLERSGLPARSFTTGAEARAFLDGGDPVAAICVDLGLPDESGLALCAAVRRHPRHAELPVLVMTGRPGLDEEARALEVGADAFLEKPFRIKAMAARVRSLVEERRALASEVTG